MLKERYYSTVEYFDRFGKVSKQIDIYCELGKKPTVGDFVEAFKNSGHEVELTDFLNLTFKPRQPLATSVTSIKVVRTIKDHTFKPCAC